MSDLKTQGEVAVYSFDRISNPLVYAKDKKVVLSGKVVLIQEWKKRLHVSVLALSKKPPCAQWYTDIEVHTHIYLCMYTYKHKVGKQGIWPSHSEAHNKLSSSL